MSSFEYTIYINWSAVDSKEMSVNVMLELVIAFLEVRSFILFTSEGLNTIDIADLVNLLAERYFYSSNISFTL